MWRRFAVCALVLAGGCASSSEIRMNADMHVARANTRAAHGDYIGAQQEMNKAHEQYLKAERRAADERYWY